MALPPVMYYQEYLASHNAVDRMRERLRKDGVPKEEQEEILSSVNRKLTGALGSYVGGAFAAPVGQLIGKKGKPFGTADTTLEKLRNIQAVSQRSEEKKKKSDKEKK